MLEPVIDTCDIEQHQFAKLPNHPTKDGRPRCPYCMAHGIDRRDAEINRLTNELKEVRQLLQAD